MREHTPSKLLLASLFLILAMAAALGLALWQHRTGSSSPAPPEINELARQVAAIDLNEKAAAQAVWSKELLAERCGQVIERLWDSLNAASNKLEIIASLTAEAIEGPKLAPPRSIAHGIQVFDSTGRSPAWASASWKQFVLDRGREGWQLLQAEFRHRQFDTDAAGHPWQSRYYCSAHLANATSTERAILEGELVVDWQGTGEPKKPLAIRHIDASQLTLKTRPGPPAFQELLVETVKPLRGSYFIDPLILYDLDGDGLSEIILPAANLVFKRQANGHFESRPLCQYPPGLIFTGLIADFDGDGHADFLCAKFDGLYLFKGSASGTFAEPGQLVWAATPHLKYAQTLTCGDIDGDGDLDVWLGQYKLPYDRGQMPTPYYDANDGYPSYLLLNDGTGHFTDATASAGLGTKRWRRAYSGSFVDFNGDGHLDLAVASDFAGIDLYTNDGHGRFQDVTRQTLAEAHGFGMSQLFADFDGDGRLDLLMLGMNVPVMDRLWHLGSPRPGFESYFSMGHAMTYGNRLYLGKSDGHFEQTGLNDRIARTGWSWGASAFDMDNDGYPDLYITNGHETKQFVQDYETEFWMHDIYVGNSKDNLAAFAYFQTKQARTRGRGLSYGGYEKNRLFLNQHGTSFVEIGHLLGVALEQDSRNVVADDLDGDGQMDLLVTTFQAWPEPKQTLRVYANRLPNPGNWIGFRLRDQPGGCAPAGARVTLHYAGRSAVQPIVVGDSYRSQTAPTAHFGLGTAQQVDRAEIRWVNGRSVVLDHPAINQYHAVAAPSQDPQVSGTAVPAQP